MSIFRHKSNIALGAFWGKSTTFVVAPRMINSGLSIWHHLLVIYVSVFNIINRRIGRKKTIFPKIFEYALNLYAFLATLVNCTIRVWQITQICALRHKGIPKSSWAHMPDLSISCSFFLCKYIENATIMRKTATLPKTGNPCSQNCPNFGRDIKVQAMYPIVRALCITNLLHLCIAFSHAT